MTGRWLIAGICNPNFWWGNLVDKKTLIISTGLGIWLPVLCLPLLDMASFLEVDLPGESSIVSEFHSWNLWWLW